MPRTSDPLDALLGVLAPDEISLDVIDWQQAEEHA